MSADTFATLGLKVDASQGISGLKQFRGESSATIASVESLMKVAEHFGIVMGATFLFHEEINNIKEAQSSMAQLEAGVKSTGAAAGFTAEQLHEQALALEEVSTFSHVAVEQTQSILLLFQHLQGIRFTEATQDAADLAARLGTDMPSAARQLGKALEDPEHGLMMLRRAGVVFTASQTDMIKQMQQSGNLMGAQTQILDLLKQKLEGSALAARETLGGAFKSLANEVALLFEVSKNSSNGVESLIEDLIVALEKVRHNIDELALAAQTLAAIFVGRWIATATAELVAYNLQVAVSRAHTIGLLEDKARETAAFLASAKAENAVNIARREELLTVEQTRSVKAQLAAVELELNAATTNEIALAEAATAADLELSAATNILTVSMEAAGAAGATMWAAIGGPIGAVVIAAYAAYKAIDYFANKGLKEGDDALVASQQKLDAYTSSLKDMSSSQIRADLAVTKKAIADLLAVINGPMNGKASQQQLTLLFDLMQKRAVEMKALVPIEKDETEEQKKKAAAFKELTEERQNEIDKIIVLNGAYDRTASELAILGLQYDAANKKIKDSKEYKGAELDALNKQTDAMLVQQIAAVGLADALKKRDEALQNFQKNADEEGKKNVDAQKLHLEAQQQLKDLQDMEAAVRSGTAAVVEENIQLAMNAARRAMIAAGRPAEAEAYAKEVEAVERQKQVLKTATDEKQAAADRQKKIDDLHIAQQKEMADTEKALWIEAAKSIQDAMSSGFEHLFTDGIEGWKSFAQDIAHIVQKMLADVLGAMESQALGIGKILDTIKEKGIEGLSKGQRNTAAGIAGFGIGYTIGQSTSDSTFGALTGAGSGALAGSMIAPGIGTAIGAIAGFAGGILGAGAAAEKAKQQMQDLTDQLNRSIQTLKGRVSGNSLEADLFNSQKEQADLLKANDEAYKNHNISLTEHQKNIEDIIGLEGKYQQSLKDEFAAKQKQLEEDSQVRLLRATGNQRQADDMAFALGQQREYADAVKKGATELALSTLQQAEAAEAAQRLAEKAEAYNNSIQDLTVRMFRAAGLGSQADDMAFTISQERELATLRKEGADPIIIEQTRQVLEMEKQARERAIADTNRKAEEDYKVRTLQAQGDDAAAARLRLQLDQEREYTDAVRSGLGTDALLALQEALGAEWQKFLDDARKATEETARQMAELTKRTNEDLGVRLLVAQGYSQEAEDAKRLLDQQREYQDAVKQGLDASTLAALSLVQAAENAAVAAARAEQEASTVGDLNVRLLTASGNSRGAEDLRMFLSQQKELADAHKSGYSTGTIDLINLVQKQETAAVKMARAIADQTASIKASSEAAQSGIQGQIDLNKALLDIADNQLQTQKKLVDVEQKTYEALSKFSESLKVGVLSTLSPVQQEAEARRQYDVALAAARSGNADAAGTLPELAKTFLEISKNNNASTMGYVDSFNYVQDSIAEIQKRFGDRVSTDQQILDTLNTQVQYLKDQISALQDAKKDAASNAQAQIDALNASIDSSSADSQKQIDELKKQLDATKDTTSAVTTQTQTLNTMQLLNYNIVNLGQTEVMVLSTLTNFFTSGYGLAPLEGYMSRTANAAEVGNFFLSKIADNTNTGSVMAAGFDQLSARIDVLAQRIDSQTGKLSIGLEAIKVK